MEKKIKQYSPEFKEYVCKLSVQDGRKMTDLSKELKIPYNTLSKWVGAYKRRLKEETLMNQNQLKSATEYKEMYERKREELIEAEEEIEILKKAMHIFTQQ